MSNLSTEETAARTNGSLDIGTTAWQRPPPFMEAVQEVKVLLNSAQEPALSNTHFSVF